MPRPLGVLFKRAYARKRPAEDLQAPPQVKRVMRAKWPIAAQILHRLRLKRSLILGLPLLFSISSRANIYSCVQEDGTTKLVFKPCSMKPAPSDGNKNERLQESTQVAGLCSSPTSSSRTESGTGLPQKLTESALQIASVQVAQIISAKAVAAATQEIGQ